MIYLGADHGGYELKEEVKIFLKKGYYLALLENLDFYHHFLTTFLKNRFFILWSGLAEILSQLLTTS